MRPLRVVVVDEDAQDAFEVAGVEDQQPVEAFGADGSDEPLGDGVCLRRLHRRLDDPDACGVRNSDRAVSAADPRWSADRLRTLTHP
jgi:hypothetical protein